MFPLVIAGTFQCTSTRKGRITLTVTSRGAEGAMRRSLQYLATASLNHAAMYTTVTMSR